jgi:hypothetical protein
MAGFLYIGDYIFAFAYPLAFMGAIFYCGISMLNINITDVIANNNLSIFLNVVIATSGLISLFNWYNADVPLVNSILLPNGRGVIKQHE